MTKNLKKQLETVNRITSFNNNQWKITYQNENKILKEEQISKLTIQPHLKNYILTWMLQYTFKKL